MDQDRTRVFVGIGLLFCLLQPVAEGQCVLDDGDGNTTLGNSAFDTLRLEAIASLLPSPPNPPNPSDGQLLAAGFCAGPITNTTGCDSDTISFTDVYQGCPPPDPDNLFGGDPQSLSLPKFDPSLGQLERVEVIVSARITDALARLENTNPIAGCFWETFSLTMGVRVDDDQGNEIISFGGTNLNCSLDVGGFPLDPYDGSPNFMGSSAAEFPCVPGGAIFGTQCIEPADFGAFTGTCPNFAMNNSCAQAGVCDCLEFPIYTQAVTTFITSCSNEIAEVISNVEITVNVRYTFLPNMPPHGEPDCAEVCERQSASRDSTVFIDVLANDFDPDGTLNCLPMGMVNGSPSIECEPDNGTATVVTNAAACNTSGPECPGRCIQYVPNVGFTGTDTFTYTITDNEDCESGPILVTVHVYAKPVANDDDYEACRNVPITLNPLANDNDDGNAGAGSCTPRGALRTGALDCDSFMILSGPPPATGTLGPLQNCGDCGTNCANCQLVFTPAPDFVGTTSFTYRIENCKGCFDDATVTIEVCYPVTAPDAFKTCEGEPFSYDVLANDTGSACSDLDCGSLLINSTSFSHGGTAIVSGCAGNPGSPQCANCVIVYTPAADFDGVETFTYQVADRDGCYSDPETVTVTVYPEPELSKLSLTLDPEVDTELIIDLMAEGAILPGGTNCVLDLDSIVITNQPDHGTLDDLGGGVFRFTPGPDFEDDQFCYSIQNVCDGLVDCPCEAEQCVNINLKDCPCINRRAPGSLLLFPEYDNRKLGFVTWFTITNTNRSVNTGSVDVEFIFREENTCLESNLTESLTAADTLSAITCDFVPTESRGYFYAYAKDNQGPISFNHLIGQLFGIDAFATCEWSVNAVSFQSPFEMGEHTNDDGDTIRDLDGVEYYEAPDQIHIPRFIANDPFDEDGFLSDLILINLSGGRLFTTTLDFTFYNDNEEPFSREFTFTCWAKPRLQDITSIVNQDNLVLTMQDPDEPFGDRTRETGWIRIDGQIAQSSVEVIVDPAFYAVLIEYDRMATAAAADLPFEYCTQANGDLLPFSLQGDGPPFSTTDNQ